MKRNLTYLLLAGSIGMTSCIDSNYDLDNIDTTAQFVINDLQIPINIDEITLDAVLDLDANSQIKVVNDEYAIREEGEFSSSTRFIPAIHAEAPFINPISAVLQFTLPETPAAASKTRAASDDENLDIYSSDCAFFYDLTGLSTDIKVRVENVDDAVVEIDKVWANVLSLEFDICFDKYYHLNNVIEELTYEDIQLKIFPGLDATVSIDQNKTVRPENKPKYDPETGIVSIPKYSTKNNTINLVVSILSMDKSMGFTFEDHVFEFNKKCELLSGRIVAPKNALRMDMYDRDGNISWSTLATTIANSNADKIDFELTPKMSDFDIKRFSGTIKYSLEDFDVSPVNISGIPEFLSQKGTDIRLGNPQIYLSIHNQLYPDYPINATAQLTFTSVVDGVRNPTRRLDPVDGSRELVLYDEYSRYCLSPEQPKTYYEPTTEKWRSFSELSDLLAGEKMPDKIEIKVEKPSVPPQHVEQFSIGKNVGGFWGHYTFFAPLALADNSHINYCDTITGWNDDTLDDITITSMKIMSEVTSEIPLKASLEITPIDKDGRAISGALGKTTTPVTLGTSNIEIGIEGEITHLDGIIIRAVIENVSESGKAVSLKPSQKITLKNTRVVVGGKIITEL